jgi:DNA-binding transcriptional MerR regulator
MQGEYFRVGELARRTGVSVRTLHHYDEIGLLRPALGGKGEHRLYGRAEVERLSRIRAIQALGLSLDEVRGVLDDPAFALAEVLELHLARIRDEMEDARRLRGRLEAIALSLRSADEVSAETFLRTIETVNDMEKLHEKYYTSEQLAALAKRREEVGEAAMADAQRQWTELFDAFREAMQRGDDPSSEPVLALARRAKALIEAFTGGDAGVERSLGRLHAENPDVSRSWGVEPALWDYMSRARAALG